MPNDTQDRGPPAAFSIGGPGRALEADFPRGSGEVANVQNLLGVAMEVRDADAGGLFRRGRRGVGRPLAGLSDRLRSGDRG